MSERYGKMIFDISDGAKFAISMLHSAGYEAYAVGGCVRDMIMQRPVCDFDITTSATPEEMKRVFSGERVVETGIKHGTLTLVYKGENVEITTYRCDGEYKDSRHPSSVSFTTSLLEDLKRRDFTVNALACDGNETLVDAFSGKSDIEKGIIRAIGDPSERFREDALRILRGIRFSSVLGFGIEEKTRAAMIENLDLLDNISRERIATEINKFVCGKYVKKAILENYEILGKIIPEVIKMNGFSQNTPYHVYDILTHTAVATQNVPPVKELRLAALFHDTGKVYSYTQDERGIGHFYGHPKISEEIVRRYLNEYRYDNFTKSRVITLVKYHDLQTEEDEVAVRKRMNKLGADLFFELTKLQRADNSAQNPVYYSEKHFEKIEAIARKIQSEECFDLKSLAVNGTDLMEAGVPKGRELGEMLKALLNEVIEEKIPNEKKALINRALEIMNTKL